MKRLLSNLAARILVSDLLSSGVSAAVLAWRGRVDARSAAAPVNAVSHWLWPREALRQDGPSARYTLTGIGIHFAAAVLWSGLYETVRACHREVTPAKVVVDAVAVSAVAAVVDLACVPDRLTPGFEKRLSPRSVAMVYAGFATGLALAGLAVMRSRSRV
jgi:hypothetical protein